MFISDSRLLSLAIMGPNRYGWAGVDDDWVSDDMRSWPGYWDWTRQGWGRGRSQPRYRSSGPNFSRYTYSESHLRFSPYQFNQEKLRNIVTTYVWENLDIGYMQVTTNMLRIPRTYFKGELLEKKKLDFFFFALYIWISEYL